MKIRVWSHDLKRAIEKAEKVAAKKASLEILEHLLLTATGDAITLTASNLTSWITVRVEGEVLESGSAILLTDDLKLIKKCSGELLIHNKYSNIVVEGIRKLEFTQMFNPSEFPESRHVVDGQKAFSINALDFKNSLKIKKMAARDETRSQLNTLNIKGSRIMALDGYRLGVINLNIDNQYTGDMMIPLDTIEQLDKVIGRRDNCDLEFTYQLNTEKANKIKLLTITGDDWTLTTRVKDGEYLNIDGVIPKEHAITINIRTKPLIETLKFFKDVKQGKKDIMTIDVTPHNMIFSKQNDKQKVSEIFEAGIHIESSIVGYKIGCNDRYLQELLETIDAEEVIINFGERNVNPITIINHDQSELYLVLPVRIAEDA